MSEGLSVILELGNKNNAGCVEFFNKVRKKNGWEKELKGIGECAKEDCVAIQLADYLAFYSWHHAVASFEAGKTVPFSSFLDVAASKVRTRGQLGEDFLPVSRNDQQQRKRRREDGELEFCAERLVSNPVLPFAAKPFGSLQQTDPRALQSVYLKDTLSFVRKAETLPSSITRS